MTIVTAHPGTELMSAVARVSDALRKLVTAASHVVGSDSYLHMEIGHALLGGLGFPAVRKLGLAAWRVGPGQLDYVGYHPQLPVYSPSEDQFMGCHAWLEFDQWVIDFTTYQLEFRAHELQGSVALWSPAYMLVAIDQLKTFEQVRTTSEVGQACYEPRADFTWALNTDTEPNPAALIAAKWLLRNPCHPVKGVMDPTVH